MRMSSLSGCHACFFIVNQFLMSPEFWLKPGFLDFIFMEWAKAAFLLMAFFNCLLL